MCLGLCVVSLTSCDDGPDVEVCVISNTSAQCSYRNGGYARTFDRLVGYVCFKPRHFEAMIRACSDGDPVAVDPCIVGATDLQCPDKRVSFHDAINYPCVSTDSMRKIVKWCVEN